MGQGIDMDFVRRYRGGPVVTCKTELASGGGVTVVFGPSGSGKSTLLRCVAGVDRPDEGSISGFGEVWFDSATRQWMPPERRRVGMLHQELALFPHLSVAGNVRYGLSRMPRGDADRRVSDVLEMLGIGQLGERRVNQVSGGERQRVALARALAPRPRALLLDEPLAGLDNPLRVRLRGELRPLLVELGIPVAMVTHDLAEALTLGDRVIVMVDGRVLQAGPVREVMRRPTSVAVARAVGIDNIVPAKSLRWKGELTGESWLCVRGEDLQLSASAPEEDAPETIAGRLVAVHDEGSLIRCQVDAGVVLTALRSADRSLPEIGSSVWLTIRPGAAVILTE